MGTWDPSVLTDRDRGRSRTSFSLDDLHRAAVAMDRAPVGRFLDIGCGYGGLSMLVGGYVGADEIHGLDIDPRVEDEARGKGVDVAIQDASEGRLPYDDGHFDVIMTLGMMDYLPSFDGVLREINRVLAPGGRVLVTLPNLSSWHNRITLLLGYQPRDIEFSHEVLTGLPAGYANETPAGHIHIPTLRAFTELMTHHGFREVSVTGGSPRQREVPRILMAIDSVLSKRPSLARRFYYVGQKASESPTRVLGEHLPYMSLD